MNRLDWAVLRHRSMYGLAVLLPALLLYAHEWVHVAGFKAEGYDVSINPNGVIPLGNAGSLLPGVLAGSLFLLVIGLAAAVLVYGGIRRQFSSWIVLSALVPHFGSGILELLKWAVEGIPSSDFVRAIPLARDPNLNRLQIDASISEVGARTLFQMPEALVFWVIVVLAGLFIGVVFWKVERSPVPRVQGRICGTSVVIAILVLLAVFWAAVWDEVAFATLTL